MDLNSIISDNYYWIVCHAHKYCKNTMDAEDLAGETILKILMNASKYDISKPFRPWCSVIMLNTYITLYNHNNLIIMEDETCGANEHSYYETEASVIAMEFDRIIAEYAATSCSVETLVLCAKGYSYDEIAKIMKIPVGTVRSRISFARDKLKKLLRYHKVK